LRVVGLLRSSRWTLCLAFGLALFQIIAWMTLILVFWRQPEEDWTAIFWGGFVLVLECVGPFMAISAMIVGGNVALSQSLRQCEPKKAADDTA